MILCPILPSNSLAKCIEKWILGLYSIKSPSLFFKMFFYISFLWTIVSSYYLTIGKNWLPLRGGEDDCILTITDNQLIITTCLYLPNSSLCISTLKVQEMLVLCYPIDPNYANGNSQVFSLGFLKNIEENMFKGQSSFHKVIISVILKTFSHDVLMMY